MLQRVKLTNFQRHRNLDVAFGGGLTALRGANEAGKSTLLRGVCYAVFGVSALADSLEETVTWGEDTKTLRAEVDLLLDGVVYSIKRGKSGAEVQYDGGSVTGQKEVTKFICDCMGVDPAAATRLMLSNQNEIRGALEAGPKATTELIERLAEFDQIDKLVDLIQEELPLGATVGIEAAIGAAEAALDKAREAAVEPDLAALNARLGLEKDHVAACKVALDAAVAERDRVKAARAVEKTNRDVLVDAERRRDTLAAKVTRLATEMDTLEAVPRVEHLEERTAELQAIVDTESTIAKDRAVFAQAKQYLTPYWGGLTWDEGPEALSAEIERTKATAQAVAVQTERNKGSLALHRQKLLAGTCTFCGKDFSGVPEVAAKNAQTALDIATLEASIRDQTSELAEDLEYLKVLQGISSVSQPAEALLIKHPTLLAARSADMPVELCWIGPDIAADRPDIVGVGRELRTLHDANKAYLDAQAQLPGLLRQVTETRGEHAEAILQVDALPTPPTENLLEAANAATLEHARAEQAHLNAQITVRRLEEEIRDTVRDYQRALQSLDGAGALLQGRKADLASVQFNNALLKRVRTARPLIADKLWNLVLSAVSSYFSEMRGERSVVSKEGDGFKVNGKSVSTLSGSTLDILGLAIRVALVRTFLPSAPFLTLDEPAAACDELRTTNMLGFLVGCGFSQVLLITHEDVSESVADNMITLS